MKLRLQLFLLITFAPALVHALGLGKLELDSALNEPFEARIELLSPTIEELDSLNVRLADEAAFNRAGIPRLALLRSLNFVVKETETGSDYIRIYSNEPIREPFLNFLLEVSWSKGRLYREYTVLLDPPVYASPEKQKRLAPSTTPPASTTGTITQEIDDNQVIYDPVYKPARVVSATPSQVPRPASYDGGDYGPTVTGDTLWSLASVMRPDSSVSVQQMMFALLRANPDAFINGNINGLKRGHVLKMPDMSDVQSLNRDEAFAQTQLQNNLWEEARGALATAVTPRPETVITEEPVVTEPEPSVMPEPAPVVSAPIEDEPELRLVAPTEAGEGAAGVTDPSGEQLANELALATESLEALTQENLELKDKLSETEAIIDDLKRLIVLKESELAALQQQIAADEAAKAAMTEAQEAETEAPVSEEPIEVAEVEETIAEEPPVKAEETVVKESEVATVDTTFVPTALTGIVDIARNNLTYLGAALGGLLLIGLGIAYAKRRHSEAAEVIPQSAFPDFSDQDFEAVSEDATDINPALVDSESVTILPDSEDQTSMPEFEIEAAPAKPVQTEKPAPAAAIIEEEEDPFTEVNYFLAYEQYDQAEELVKKIIAKDPENIESHSKLLEVYYAANNKKGYEEAARVLHDKVQGQGDYWSMAVAMWQEISPNRALFAESGGEEEDRGTAASGGGIVNIAAGDESVPAGLDFDLDTTASGADALDMATEEAGDMDADILDVTAAIDMDDDAVLDVTAATENESDADEPAATETKSADDNSLDFEFDLEEGESQEEAGSDMDISLDVTQEASAVAAAADDNSLDFSIDLEMDEAKAEIPDSALDVSMDTPQSEQVDVAADDNSLDFSFDLEKDESKEEMPAAEMDISLDDSQAKEAAPATDDNALDFSYDLEKDENQQKESSPDVLDTSFNVTDDEKSGNADLLDVTSAISLDNEDEAIDIDTDAGEKVGDDLLDVTKTRSFEPDSDADLLDVTAATSASMDADELLDNTKAGVAGEAEDNLLDFELSPDGSNETDVNDSELTFDVIDITAGQSNSGPGIDFNIDTDDKGDEVPEIDMEGTMPMPKRAALELDMETEDEAPSDSEFELVLDEDDDADHTIMVPRSSGTAQQSEEDEIASQLDLAKAYVELGDADNAKTILNEIIAIGNAEQQQQARELLGQI